MTKKAAVKKGSKMGSVKPLKASPLGKVSPLKRP